MTFETDDHIGGIMEYQENLRDIVVDILLDIEKNQTPSHVALGRMLQKFQYLENHERRFISRLTKGTLERQITLDWMIGRFSSVKVKKMKPVIRAIIRMSVYQLFYMDGVPVSAVCNEAVKLTKKRGFKNLSGFVNGILRNMSRDPKKCQPDPENLSVFYSQPQWLVDEWTARYGKDQTKKISAWFLNPAPVTIRLVKGRISAEEFEAQMAAEGITAVRHSLIPNAYRISGFDYLESIDAFIDGCITVMDVSSMLAVKAAAIKPQDQIIDVCAAPGGKSLMAAELLEGSGHITARDLTEDKVALIEENIERLGAEHISAMVWDATVKREADKETADIVIADLPCSGLGVIGRKPDIRLRVLPEDLTSLAALQRQILTEVSDYVKPGGHLIYSTCTVSQEENENNVKWFLEHFPFEAESLEGVVPTQIKSETIPEGYVQLLPGTYDTDGFFIARFRKKQENKGYDYQ